MQGRRAARKRQRQRVVRGEVWALVRTGHIVVKPSNGLPRLGWEVLDGSGRRIGVVSDIIGNVGDPYVVVKPSDRGLLQGLQAGVQVVMHPPRREAPAGRGRRRGAGRVVQKGGRRVRERDLRGYGAGARRGHGRGSRVERRKGQGEGHR